MELHILAEDASHFHVATHGDITMEHIFGDEDPLERLIEKDGYAKRVIINLENTPMIDSAGIGWLVRCHKRFVQNNGCFIVHSLSPAVAEVFELVRLNTIVNVTADYDAARSLDTSSGDNS